MSSKLWEYFIYDDVDGFQRYLANATFAGPRAAGAGGASGAAANVSLKTASPGSTIASSPNPAKGKKALATSPDTPLPDRSTPQRGNVRLSRAAINARDHYGRTLLHHIASSRKPTASEFARSLLEVPSVDIYVQDAESGWTALHRALYAGNATIAQALMVRDMQDMTDISRAGNTNQSSGGLIKIKDREGYSPFDVYGRSISANDIRLSYEDFNREIPWADSDDPDSIADLRQGPEEWGTYIPEYILEGAFSVAADEVFALGSNKNLNLGLGDQDDRQFPERVSLKRPEHLLHRFYREYQEKIEKLGLEETVPKSDTPELPTLVREKPIKFKDVVMSKLHTAIITGDPESNLFMCGFGPGGRLGTGDESTRFTFTCIEKGGLEGKKVIAAALGQDHSLAITENGEIFSWGSNKFGQLGYNLPRTNNHGDVPMQLTPRQIFNPFKKELIFGAAASSIHSVVFSSSALYTFGKNEGQLGLVDSDARSLEKQTTPRRVGASLFTCPILMVSATDRATSVLLQNHDVWVFSSYGYSKLSFPLETRSRFIRNSFMATRYNNNIHHIQKIASGGNTICALSNTGEVFTVEVNQPDTPSALTSTTNPAKIRSSLSSPVRAWAVKKSHMAAEDVDVGQDGSIIICTTSGSAWKKERRTKKKQGASKDYKFSRIPGLCRAIAVRSNTFGAYAIAQRQCDLVKREIMVEPGTFVDDLLPMSPFLFPGYRDIEKVLDSELETTPVILSAGASMKKAILSSSEMESQFLPVRFDGMVWLTSSTSDLRIPVHEFLLAARSPILRNALLEFRESFSSSVPDVFAIEYGDDGHPQISIQNVDFMSVITLAFFMYTDQTLDGWLLTRKTSPHSVRFRQVRLDLIRIAEPLGLETLHISAMMMYELQKSLKSDLARALNQPSFFDTGDVVVQLKGTTIKVHSPLVCLRCPFFDTLFHGHAGGRWLESRKSSPTELVHVDLKHIDRSIFEFVLRYLYADTEEGLFGDVRTDDVDGFIDLVLDVTSAANELMIDRLSQICQKMLGRFVTIRNVCYLLNSLAPCSVTEFKDSALRYICENLEAMLANRYLEDLDSMLLTELDQACQENQSSTWRVSRVENSENSFRLKHPEIVAILEEDKRRRIDAMAIQSRLGHLESGEVRPRPTPNDKVASSPSVRKAKATSARESPIVGNSPMLKPRQSVGDLMFQMDDESPMSPGDSKGKSVRRGLKFAEGIPENRSYPDSPALGASIPEAESLGERNFLDDGLSSPQGNLLALGSPSDPTSAPWSSPMVTGSKKDLKEIMGEASQSRVSNLTLGMADRRESNAKSTSKMSQKERKKIQQEQLQEQLAAQKMKKDAPQNPWQKPQTSSPSTSSKLDPLPGQNASSSGPKQAQRSMTMRQTVAGTPPPKAKPVEVPTQAPRRSVSGHPQPSPHTKHSTSGPSAAPQSNQPTSPPPAIQSIRHIPRPDPIGMGSPSSGSYSLSTILLQQQSEKEAIREAATAKHNMQEIQAEQEFQQWWDQESRRVQGLQDPEPSAASESRTGKAGRGEKTPGTGSQRRQRGNKPTGNSSAPQDQRRVSAPSSGHASAKASPAGQPPTQPQKARGGKRPEGASGTANTRRGQNSSRAKGKDRLRSE
ncbi:hypothetical protein N7452_010128 [Penicillium brevicompactum]|uniref:BTB domain-containing protein n=1 Tax=Penicillium brevicompactum TaxID=5074 RepID=A0A9W9QCW1_PENBR|nr:hypothetical protein N7452_010128 [Penicillium brevicompactum]